VYVYASVKILFITFYYVPRPSFLYIYHKYLFENYKKSFRVKIVYSGFVWARQHKFYTILFTNTSFEHFSDVNEMHFTALLASASSLPVRQVCVPEPRLNDRKHRCARRWTHPTYLPTCRESGPKPTYGCTTIIMMRIGPRAARNSWESLDEGTPRQWHQIRINSRR